MKMKLENYIPRSWGRCLVRCVKGFILIGILISFSYADHACIEGIPIGKKIHLNKSFPNEWFMVNGSTILDSGIFVDFKSKYKDNWTSGSEESFTSESFCGVISKIYVNISRGNFGPSIELSTMKPKCRECNSLSNFKGKFELNSGLKIGQSKVDVSKHIIREIASDTTTIEFNEIEKVKNREIFHSQIMTLIFTQDKLTNIFIFDSRESNK